MFKNHNTNELRKILSVFLGTRKIEEVIKELLLLPNEKKHTHDEEIFYTHKGEDGELVFTKDSVNEIALATILLKARLEREEVEECSELLMKLKSSEDAAKKHATNIVNTGFCNSMNEYTD